MLLQGWTQAITVVQASRMYNMKRILMYLMYLIPLVISQSNCNLRVTVDCHYGLMMGVEFCMYGNRKVCGSLVLSPQFYCECKAKKQRKSKVPKPSLNFVTLKTAPKCQLSVGDSKELSVKKSGL